MKPALADTSTSRTMPNFDSSAKRATRPRTRSTRVDDTRARGAAVSALGGTGYSGHRTRGAARLTRHSGAPAARADADPDQGGPEQIGDDGVRGAKGNGEAAQHRGNAEADLHEGKSG